MEQLPSISGLLQVAAGSAVVGLALGYAWWSKIRITLFREDLFLIRDRMWDQARDLGALDDPKYQYTRELLNSCISAASYVSLPQLVRSRFFSTYDHPPAATTKCADVIQITSDAELRLRKRVIRHVLLERPFSGLFFAAALIVCTLSILAPLAFVRAWTASKGPHELSVVAAAQERGAMSWRPVGRAA